MGLDMYLYTRRFVSEYRADTNVGVNRSIRESIGLSSYEGWLYIDAQLAYWRKAHEIHRWFVENIQKNVDNCAEYHVPQEKLVELRDWCASELTKFDGKSGYLSAEHWEREHLKYTIEICDQILEDPALANCNVYYRSSW